MKVVTPEISWHGREPVYSIDFQPGERAVRRIASGGVDKIVRIWHFNLDKEGKGCVEFLSNLRRHTATVNVVRFSKNGDLLASAGDDTAIILWKLSDVPPPTNNIFNDEDGDEDKETWVCHKTLRGHLGDVADLSWSKDNRYLVSGSVDNSAIVWDIVKDQKVAMFTEHKSYVQGVAFDPFGDLIATLCTDRSLRLYNVHSKCCINNVSKMASLQPTSSSPGSAKGDSRNKSEKPKSFRIFQDDSLLSFFRRLEFSPCGQFLITPAGCIEQGDGKLVNSSFVFCRGAFAKPALYLPSGEKATTVARVNPQLFHLRHAPDGATNESESGSTTEKEWEKHKSLFALPYRVVYAVASEDSVLLYDTQQTMPVGLLKNIHYHQISDLSWSGDGKVLVVSSTDGFCTIVTFEDGELGEIYTKPEVKKAVSTGPSVSKDPQVKNQVISEDGDPSAKSSEKSLPFSRYTSPKSEQKAEEKTSETKTDSPSGKDDTSKMEVSQKVESLTITDAKDNVTSDSKTRSDKTPEGPKKKRIQLTTLSLKK